MTANSKGYRGQRHGGRPPAWLVRAALAASAALGAAGCSDAPLIAPNGSRIEISVAPTLLAADGDTAVVSVYVTEADGAPVADGTQVVLTATGGTLCAAPTPLPWFLRPEAQPPSCAGQLAQPWPTIVELQTTAGVGTALVRSGPAAGPLGLRARSGGVSETTSVNVSGVTAPAGAKLVLQAEPDTIALNRSSTITAYLTTAENVPVPDGTLVIFAAPDHALSRSIAVARGGFARSVLTGKKGGDAVVTVTSGTTTGQVTVTVSAP
jgi:hypothetical protein